MTREETAVILGTIKVAYPRAYADMSNEDVKNTLNLWSAMFVDEPLEAVHTALYKHMATSKFPPTIAELRESLSNVIHDSAITSGEAWQEVIYALRNFGYSRPGAALDSMSELTRNAVKCIGWQSLCESEAQMADRAHFMKIYETLEKRRAEQRKIPATLQNKINQCIEAHSIVEDAEHKSEQKEAIPESILNTFKRIADTAQAQQGVGNDL